MMAMGPHPEVDLGDGCGADLGAGVVAHPPARVIGVRVGDESPRHRAPRVDVKIPARAVKTGLGQGEERLSHGLLHPAARAI